MVRLRDAFAMASEALNEYIQSLALPEIEERKAELPSSENLETLPWRSYQTKQDAKPDEAAWIFSDTKGAEALLAILKTRDKTQIGAFEYSRSGREKQFISRKPLKPKA